MYLPCKMDPKLGPGPRFLLLFHPPRPQPLGQLLRAHGSAIIRQSRRLCDEDFKQARAKMGWHLEIIEVGSIID